MYYFQEDNEVFTDYYEKYINLTNQLLKAYMDIHIHKKSSFKDSKYVLRPLIYELHGDYLKTKKKISLVYNFGVCQNECIFNSIVHIKTNLSLKLLLSPTLGLNIKKIIRLNNRFLAVYFLILKEKN